MKRWILFFLALVLAVQLSSQQDNPFDLDRGIEPLFKSDTLRVGSSADTAIETTKIEGDNPFAISHIPIRKNQMEQIEDLSFLSENEVRETLDISYMPLWLLAFSLCLLAVIIYIKNDHFNTLLRSLFNDNFMRLIQYEQSKGRSPVYHLGYLLFLLNMALFIHLVLINVFDKSFQHQYWWVLAAITIFCIAKHVVNAIFAKIFYVEKEQVIYDFTIITIYNTLSVVFLVINILAVFGPDVWNKPLAVIGVLIFIISLLVRFYKGFHIGRHYVNNYFVHFFLYFCALEISPWILVYTLIKDHLLIN